MFVQGVLTIQPTVTKADKSRGLALHQVFQIAGLAISMVLDNTTAVACAS